MRRTRVYFFLYYVHNKTYNNSITHAFHTNERKEGNEEGAKDEQKSTTRRVHLIHVVYLMRRVFAVMYSHHKTLLASR